MNFLNPFFLFGLAAAAVPVLIHLLTRRRPRRVEFSSVEFLREVRVAELRRFRLREWLLLLLRVLAIACLALALARPAVRGLGGGSRGSTTALLLIDRSFSLQAREGDRTLFTRAQARAVEVLDALEPGDRVQVMAFDHAATAAFPDAIEDHGRARAAIRSLAVSNLPTDLEAALTAAIEALGKSASLHRELYVFTDLQRAGLSRESPSRTLPGGLRVTFLAVSDAPGPDNLAAAAARYRPGEPPAIEARVASFGSAASREDVPVVVRSLVDAASRHEVGRGFLSSDGAGAGGLVILREEVPLGGEIELGGDALALDDRRAFAAGRAGVVRVGWVGGPAREGGLAQPPIRLVLEAGVEAGRFAFEPLEVARLTADEIAGIDVLVLDDVGRLGEGALQAVVDYARGGGSVVAVLGPNTDPAFWNQRLFAALGGLTIRGTAPARAERGAWSLRREAVGHPALAGLPDGAGEALSSAEFRAAWSVDPGPEGRVLARFSPALPALVERERLLVFTSDAGGAWSDFPFSGVFLPFWHQALRALAQGNSLDLAPGERLDLPSPAGEGRALWTLRAPSGREIPLAARLVEGAPRLLSPPLEETGPHLLLASGRVVRAVPVNPDLEESDLARLTFAEARRRFASLRPQVVSPTLPAARLVREGRYGRELWRELLVAALVLLLAETVLARRWGAAIGEESVETRSPARAAAGGR